MKIERLNFVMETTFLPDIWSESGIRHDIRYPAELLARYPAVGYPAKSLFSTTLVNNYPCLHHWSSSTASVLVSGPCTVFNTHAINLALDVMDTVVLVRNWFLFSKLMYVLVFTNRLTQIPVPID